MPIIKSLGLEICVIGTNFGAGMQSHDTAGDPHMRKGRFKVAMFLASFVLVGQTAASAQQTQQHSQRPERAEGTVAVTATVVSSAGVVIGPDGQPHIIIANAVDPTGDALPVPVVNVDLTGPPSDQKPEAKSAQEKQKQR
ncbi:MAG TPA: hypothetical protein VIB39_03070 [Candidatus Angelobacter sp.]